MSSVIHVPAVLLKRFAVPHPLPLARPKRRFWRSCCCFTFWAADAPRELSERLVHAFVFIMQSAETIDRAIERWSVSRNVIAYSEIYLGLRGLFMMKSNWPFIYVAHIDWKKVDFLAFASDSSSVWQVRHGETCVPRIQKAWKTREFRIKYCYRLLIFKWKNKRYHRAHKKLIFKLFCVRKIISEPKNFTK